MKKLFISCPMRGRTDEAIVATREAMHKIAEEIFGEKLEVIQNHKPCPAYIEDVNKSIWCLGRSVQMMAEADYFIYVSGVFNVYKGCGVELNVARDYDIPYTSIHLDNFDACKDVKEAMDKYWEARHAGKIR